MNHGGNTMGRKGWPQAIRARAVELFRSQPASEVAAELGVPEGTIRRWVKQARDRDGGKPPDNATPAEIEQWAVSKERAARDQFSAMERALEKVRELLDAGDTSAARNAAITLGILADKSGILQEAAERATDREHKLAEQFGGKLAEVLIEVFKDLGLDHQVAVPLIRYHFTKLAGKEPEKPNVDEVRSAVRAKFREEWERELPKVPPIAELPPGEQPQPKRRKKRSKPKPERRWVPEDVIEAEARERKPARKPARPHTARDRVGELGLDR